MKPPVFEYAAPRTVAEAARLLGAHDGEAKVLAGGQSLMPLLAMRLSRPTLLVDLGRIEGLEYVRDEGGEIAIGAMTTKTAVLRSPIVASRAPLFAEATRLIGHPQIRNRGTVGGSMAHADPAAEYPAAALVLGARMRAASEAGERTIDAAEFFVMALTTALSPGEILTEVRVPAQAPRSGWSILEVSRRHGDFAMAGAAVTLSLAAEKIASPRIVLFGIGTAPVRAHTAEEAIDGQRPGATALRAAAERARAAAGEPLADLHASAEYRRHLAGVLVERALAQAVARAGGTS